MSEAEIQRVDYDYCPNCEATNEVGDTACEQCGEPLPDAKEQT